MKTRLLVSSILLFVFTLGFNALLTSTSLDKLLGESLISKYLVVGKRLQRNLERIHLQSDQFDHQGNSVLLEEVQKANHRLSVILSKDRVDHSGTEDGVWIALPDGTPITDPGRVAGPNTIDESVWLDFAKDTDPKRKGKLRQYHHGSFLNHHYVSLPIRGLDNRWLATIIIRIDEQYITNYRQPLLRDSFRLFLSITAGGILFLLLALGYQLRHPAEDTAYPKRKVAVTLFLIISVAQISFSLLTANAFKSHYVQANRDKALATVRMLKEDIESALAVQGGLHRLNSVETAMARVIETSSELNDIIVYSKKWEPLFIATQKEAINSKKAPASVVKGLIASIPPWNPEHNVRLDITTGDGTVGYISADIDIKAVFSKLWEIGMDSLTVLIISLLVFAELMILISKYMELQGPVKFLKTNVNQGQTQAPVHYSLIRPVFFLLLFGLDFSISFIPLHMEKLYVPMFGLSKDIILSLPVSMTVFFSGVGFFMAGAWNDRRGWHRPFLTGVALAALGNIYSGVAPNAYHFILAQVVTGLGYGLAFMASQGFVIAYTDSKTKAQGFASLFAALYVGGFCGSSTGAMLAERVGYRPVFIVGALIILTTIGYTLLFMRHAFVPKATLEAAVVKLKKRKRSMLQFLSRRNVIVLILFSSIPANMAMIGFLNYFNPLYLSRIGISQSNIGRTFMIYCALSIYFGPWISRYIDASANKKGYLVAGGIIGSLAFMVYYFFQGLAASVLAIFLLGISQSFVFVVQAAYLLKLRVSHELGEGKAIATFRLMNYFAQVVGPIVFGWLVVATEMNKGLTFLGLAYFAMTLGLVLFLQKDERSQGISGKQYLAKEEMAPVMPSGGTKPGA